MNFCSAPTFVYSSVSPYNFEERFKMKAKSKELRAVVCKCSCYSVDRFDETVDGGCS